LEPSLGDARCLSFGHLVRLAIWQLRSAWQQDADTKDKMNRVRAMLQGICPLDLVDRLAAQVLSSLSEVDLLAAMRVQEVSAFYDTDDEIPF
jgi:hypothetical protein